MANLFILGKTDIIKGYDPRFMSVRKGGNLMDFKISLIEGHPVWDALPVGKIIYYPLEKRVTALCAGSYVCQ